MSPFRVKEHVASTAFRGYKTRSLMQRGCTSTRWRFGSVVAPEYVQLLMLLLVLLCYLLPLLPPALASSAQASPCEGQCLNHEWEGLSPAAREGFCLCVNPAVLRMKLSNYSSSEAYLSEDYFPKELAAELKLQSSQVHLRGWTKEDSGVSVITIVWLLPLTKRTFPQQFLREIQRKIEKRRIRLNKAKYGDYSFVSLEQLEPPSPPPPFPPSPSPPPSPPPHPLPPPGAPSSSSTNSSSSGGGSKGSTLLAIVGGVVGLLVLLFCVAAVVFCWIRRRREGKTFGTKDRTDSTKSLVGSLQRPSSKFDGSSLPRPMSVRVFSYQDLMEATNNFDNSTLLGEGGFGRVYRGTLKGGLEVAIKKLTSGGHQGDREFLVEVEMLSKLHHRHLVKLLGYYSSYSHQLLCYELVPNGSLEQWLHGRPGQEHHGQQQQLVLDWPTRMKIAIGAARGLAYLHEDAQPCVIHRDFKSSNILLEMNFHAKVADFGLAKSAPEGPDGYISTRVMGTFGYVAPEYAMTGHLLVKSDVYSYGVVLLELLSGRKPVDMSQPAGQENLVTWSRPRLYNPARHLELLDPLLDAASVPPSDLRQVAAIAAACVEAEANQRPTMGEVVQSLKLVQHDLEFSSQTSDLSGLQPPFLLSDDATSGAFDPTNGSTSGPLHNGHNGSFVSDSGPLFQNQASSSKFDSLSKFDSGPYGEPVTIKLSEGR